MPLTENVQTAHTAITTQTNKRKHRQQQQQQQQQQQEQQKQTRTPKNVLQTSTGTGLIDRKKENINQLLWCAYVHEKKWESFALADVQENRTIPIEEMDSK